MKKKIASLIIFFIVFSIVGLFLIYTSRPRLFLAFSIILPIALLIIFYKNKWLGLNHKNLLVQPIFIASIAVPFYTFIMYGLWAWKDHSINFTADGFSNFILISKLPLILLASSVPLAAIISNIHRTIQTEAQIISSENKNAVDRYLAHEKNFIEKTKEISTLKINNYPDELFKDLKDKDENEVKPLTTREVRISNGYQLYTKIYTKASIHPDCDYTPNEDFKNQLIKTLDTIEKNLDINNIISNDDEETSFARLNSVTFNTALLLDTLCVESISHIYTVLESDNYKMKTFSHLEGLAIEILEAAFFLCKKILKLVYGENIEGYNNLYNYFYIGTIRFSTLKITPSLQSFYAPEWLSYVSEHVEIINGGNMAAES